MIASVRGTVLEVGSESVVIEVGGLGVLVQCTPATLAGLRKGQAATVHTALVVREDSLTLYGFADADERSVFEVLQTVSGVGPRLAQATLGAIRPDDLRAIVARDDVAALTQVPGVGKKGAQRLILELKDKLGVASGGEAVAVGGSAAAPSAVASAWRPQVHAALVGLGWPPREADAALSVVADEFGADADGMDVAVLLRTALRAMSGSVSTPGGR